VPVNSEVLVHLNNFESSVHEARPPGPCINCKREDVTKRRGENNHCFILLSSMHMHSKMMTVFVEYVRLDLENHWKCPTIQKKHQVTEN
jgi:hypothetical protein